MEYIYNPKIRTIEKYEKKHKEAEKICLTYHESKFLEALIDNEMYTYGDISEYIYGFYDKACRNPIRMIKTRLLKKVKLKIKTVVGVRF